MFSLVGFVLLASKIGHDLYTQGALPGLSVGGQENAEMLNAETEKRIERLEGLESDMREMIQNEENERVEAE